MFEKLSKKLVTTLCGMASLNYIAFLVYKDTLDHIHKIELYALIIAGITSLAGIHGLLQSKIDKSKQPSQGETK